MYGSKLKWSASPSLGRLTLSEDALEEKYRRSFRFSTGALVVVYSSLDALQITK